MKQTLSWCLVAGHLVFGASAAADLLVATNSVWKYRKGTSEASSPTDAWRQLNFNDSGWSTGAMPVYYDANNVYTGNTVLNDMRHSYTCVFLRRVFVVSDVESIGTLQFRAFSDDGYVAWINGTRVHGHNYDSTDYTHTRVATAGAVEPLQWSGVTIPNPSVFLREGTNILAVQAFNRPITSSDFVINLELTSAEADATPPTVLSVDPPPGTITALGSITVTFSEPVTGVAATDLVLNGSPALAINGSGASYTFTVNPPPPGPVTVGWDPGAAIVDFGVPPNAFDSRAPAAGWQYTVVDLTPPTVVSVNPPAGVTVRQLNQLTVQFSEAVSGVSANDLLINGVSAITVSGTLAGPYLFEFPPAPAGTVELRWAVAHGIRDQASPPNVFEGGSWTCEVDPDFVIAPVRINEILASAAGDAGLRDEDDELEDWIELWNTGTQAVNLSGWSLSDDRDNPGKWIFPAMTLGAREYLVVFASGKDRKPTGAGANLHTNFKLNVAGDYLGLFNAESPRQVMTEFAPEFPEQRSDHSYGYDGSDALRHFSVPTPGAANGSSAIVGVVPPVHCNVSRGQFEQPFTLIMSSPMSGVAIRFTTDGREPTASTGTPYTGSFVIGTTTILRAAAFRTDYLPSTIATHTYIFPEQVAQQSNTPPGVPTVWVDPSNRSWTADYEMDPEITQAPAYRDLMKDALRALPVLSIVTKPEDMFDNTTGIYPKSQNRGPSWERPASVELMLPDGSEGFQIDCGIQCQGNSVRDPVKTPKHAFRLVFKGDYGPSKLRYPFFPGLAIETFDTLTLRADFNFSWLHWSDAQRPRGQRTRDAFLKDCLRDMGSLSTHNRYVHLYLNGLYWGIYDPTERPDAGFAQQYLGGEKGDYDVVNEGAAVDGNLTAYHAMLGVGNLAQSSQYELMKQDLDVPQYIDYTLLHFYVGHEDWGLNKNWYTIRRRVPGEGFRYVCWDGENTLGSTGYNRVSNPDTASGLHTQLVANSQYRLDFADRVQRHFFRDGALTPDRVAERWLNRSRELELAVVAESARWGDYRRDVHQYSSAPYELYTRDEHWIPERDRLLNQYFPGRTGMVLGQLRAAGLYPANAVAPVFSAHGGSVAPGFALTMSAPSGTIHFTTNGADPRVMHAGTVAVDARVYAGPVALHTTVSVKARTLLSGEWSALSEATFEVGHLGSLVRFTEIMYNPVGGDPYEFVELHNAGSAALDLSGFYLEGITYVFPPGARLEPGQIVVLAASASPLSFAERYPGVVVFEYFGGSLSNGGERLVLRDAVGRLVTAVDYDDENGWPSAADGFGPSLEIVDPLGDPNAPANWQARSSASGSPGVLPPPPVPGEVRLNEVMAHNLNAVARGTAFPDWIELHNPGAQTVDLSGWSLTDDSQPRKFVFPADTAIAAGGFLIVWCDSDFLEAGLHAGFALDRDGETVSLFDAATHRVDALTFGRQLTDLCLGRVESASEPWVLCEPTPGAVNRPQALAPFDRLIINEWLANPGSGDSSWIELHNRDAALPVALRGLHLTAGSQVSRLESLSFIDTGGFVRIWTDAGTGWNRADLMLQPAGDTLGLHDPSALELDRVTFGAQSVGVSEGRWPDGDTVIIGFPESPSPGASNYLPVYSGAVLNELMAWNSNAVTNSTGRTADWIELYNANATPWPMGGLGMGERSVPDRRWIFPANTTVPSQGYLVVWFDGSAPASTVLESTLNTGQTLGRRGGELALFDPAGRVLDSVRYGLQVRNLSVGREAGDWRLLAAPTPGALNGPPAALGNAGTLRINEWMAAPLAGEDWFELFNPGPVPVMLAGLSFSDCPGAVALNLPRVGPLNFVGARGYVRIDADGSSAPEAGSATFRLNASGEAILVFGMAGELIDAVYFGWQMPGVSEGRLPDGDEAIAQFGSTPTPGSSNYLPFGGARINEVLTHTDPPLEDAIELHNPTSEDVNVGGWYLSDDLEHLKKYRIADGTVLGAGQFRVFYEFQFNGGPGSLTPFLLDSVRGESLYLSAADAAGNLSGHREVVAFGAAANGVSLGRYRTSVGEDFVALSARTFGVDEPTTLTAFRGGGGLSNAYPEVGPIVVSEIMYRPQAGEGPDAVEKAEEEYVELHNFSAVPVPLFDPDYPTNRWRFTDGVEFEFPPGVSVPAHGYLLVVGFDPIAQPAVLTTFRTMYALPDTTPVHGPFAGRLDNAGERLALSRPDRPQQSPQPDAGYVPYLEVERVVYAPTAPWPVAAPGTSLQRIAAAGYGNDPVNWLTAAASAGRSNLGTVETNHPPAMDPIADQAVDEEQELSFAITATDPDGPAQTLAFMLIDPPLGASIHPVSGIFSWSPSEAQGPAAAGITVKVTDNGVPPLEDLRSFTVVVREVNRAPVLRVIPDQTTILGDTLQFTVLAEDADYPANVLHFSLVAVPAGMALHPDTGRITWTPTVAQAGTVHEVTVRVTDNGTPGLSDTATFHITVPSADAPRLMFVGYSVSGVRLKWTSVPGRIYRVQYKDELQGQDWSELPGDIVATHSVAESIDATNPLVSARYYRILVVD